MNKERRAAIIAVMDRMGELQNLRDELRDEIETIKSEEEDYKANMPQSFQDGEPGEKAGAAIERLQTAFDAIDNWDFDEVTNALEESKE